MLNSVTILDKIRLDPPVPKIYSRLGYKKKITSLSLSDQKETDRHIDEAVSLISLQGAFLVLSIHHNDGRTIDLSDGPSLCSTKLAAFLRGCRRAALMGATAGSTIMNAIREKTNEGDLTAAVVYDATASEMADDALDWIMAYINRQLLREGTHLLPRRFSAGYADFALDNQKEMYEKLQLDKIGVALTPSFLLVPEKSVTAIGGIV